MDNYIKFFREVGIEDIGEVGGKNASLGEMFQKLTSRGVQVPDGFATTSNAYREFLVFNKLESEIKHLLDQLDLKQFENLSEIGSSIRSLIMSRRLPQNLIEALEWGFDSLNHNYGPNISLAVRSSATAEDLPQASFAGQQETYLNINSKDQLTKACQQCFASLFTNRAIKYREDHGFDHMQVSLSVGVQLMVRADSGCSGVIFTIDPDSGFRDVIHVSGVWGIGENIVQGKVNPDEFYVFKPTLRQGLQAIINRKLGTKSLTMKYADPPAVGLVNLPTQPEQQHQFVLSDDDVHQLAHWSLLIEEHYQRPMDIEWAKDGETDQIFILQARPETVFSAKSTKPEITTYRLVEKSRALCSGSGLGNRIAKGKARILKDPGEAHKLKSGEVLVTPITNPDWDPILRKAAAIITDKGGRTSHAAIVAREMGTVAVVGAGNATEVIEDGQNITVSCAQGNQGVVYEGLLDWEEQTVGISDLKEPKTKPMLILGDPQQAFKYSFYPNQGIGLLRLEFLINNSIKVHPMALKHFERVKDPKDREAINQLCVNYHRKPDYFVKKLAEGIATIAAAFYPKDVIVRMSDFKSNEYANLIGGNYFEPKETNPMLGFRGASRYYHPNYRDGFDMECQALNVVRNEMGLDNVKVMIPFCRTLNEARLVTEIMASHQLTRQQNGLELYMMIEIPSNVLLAAEFAQYFDGFSIGSNDLTQLALGVDRDSELLSDIFDVNDPAVLELIRMVVKTARDTGTVIGLCGQAPSDYPEFTRFLVDLGIDSISFNPDALFTGIENINKAELLINEALPRSH